MIIKEADDRSADISMLEQLLTLAANGQKKSIETELRNLRAGIKAEKDAAYLIDFHYRDSRKWAVIHDLRIEVDGRVAQIDHLLISRTMLMFALETKSFHAGFKITDDGEFLRWNDYRKTYEGMASPIAQNERHMLVLKSLLKQMPIPTRMGFRLEPKIMPLVLVSPNCRIDRPRKFDSSCVIKADALKDAVTRTCDAQSALALAKVVRPETLEELSRAIAAHHQPAAFDYAARFGIRTPQSAAPDNPRSEAAEQDILPPAQSTTPATYAPAAVTEVPAPTASTAAEPRCRHCESLELVILHGKYGYYFKCSACSGNTRIRVHCGHASHKERLRKDARRFYRECADCRTSSLFYENPDEAACEGRRVSSA